MLDGPLRGRRQLPRTIGYVKTQQKQYLPANLSPVVTSLRAGQRTPVFRLVTHLAAAGRGTCGCRAPAARRGPGIVRIECSPDFTVEQAIELADLSAATLPRLASSPYKDPRAPQNLVPIAGLERRLRGLLGDARVLHRALTMASAVAYPLSNRRHRCTSERQNRACRATPRDDGVQTAFACTPKSE